MRFVGFLWTWWSQSSNYPTKQRPALETAATSIDALLDDVTVITKPTELTLLSSTQTKHPTHRGKNLFSIKGLRFNPVSLPRVINFKFPPAATPELLLHIVTLKNLAFHSLLGWRIIILPILTTSLIYFSSKGCENVLFELGNERVIITFHYFPLYWTAGVVSQGGSGVEDGERFGDVPAEIFSYHSSKGAGSSIRIEKENEWTTRSHNVQCIAVQVYYPRLWRNSAMLNFQRNVSNN